MNAPHPPIQPPAPEAREDIEQAQRKSAWRLAARIVVKIVVVASGLALGGILGLIIAVLSGLVDFSC